MTYLSLISGDDATLAIVVTNSDSGALVDLTDMALTFMVRRRPSDEDALITKTTADGIVIAPDQSADKGEATITLADTDTDDLAGVFPWELEGIDSLGNTSTLASGRIRITADLIHDAGS